ncbi:hypothetical protein H5410_056686 [Solanum commersonii]|uniref:Secreted protein n=1 Tax=Solanum commersonii TaxID=4109 RepID=A0A9J5WNE8_SOLCO|nr:hypothetical protein H5410_056686 [Solanum commersonii]
MFLILFIFILIHIRWELLELVASPRLAASPEENLIGAAADVAGGSLDGEETTACLVELLSTKKGSRGSQRLLVLLYCFFAEEEKREKRRRDISLVGLSPAPWIRGERV